MVLAERNDVALYEQPSINIMISSLSIKQKAYFEFDIPIYLNKDCFDFMSRLLERDEKDRIRVQHESFMCLSSTPFG